MATTEAVATMSSMTHPLPTTTSTSEAATSVAASSMTMNMAPSDCKSSMFWNWYTLDACFFSSHWRVKSHLAFTATCIGVIFLVLALEFLRRSQRELDRYIVSCSQQASSTMNEGNDRTNKDPEEPPHSALPLLQESTVNFLPMRNRGKAGDPSLLIHAARAALYTLQFGVAYAIMLMAMYYNGYIIMSILFGAFLGFYLFSRDTARGEAKASNGMTENAACCA